MRDFLNSLGLSEKEQFGYNMNNVEDTQALSDHNGW